MTVPSEAEFSASIAVAHKETEVSYLLPEADEAVSRDTALAYFEAREVARLLHWGRFSETAAVQWLRSQREYSRARAIVFGTRRSKRRTEIDAQRVQASRDDERAARVDRMIMRASDRGRPLTSVELVRLTTGSFANSWMVVCLEAFAEYFDPNAIDRMMTAARSIGPAAAELDRALKSYLAHAKTIAELKLRTAPIQPRLQLTRLAETGLQFPQSDVFPVRRIDDRSGERLFVYRMLWANRSAVRHPRTDAIAELMGIEGIRHQYDTRTIERLCSEFTGTQRRQMKRWLPGQEAGRKLSTTDTA